jgi:ribose transport system permease protein
VSESSVDSEKGSPAQPGTPTQRRHSPFRAKYVSEYAVLVLIIVLGVALSLTTENFAQLSNIYLILDQTSTLLIVALPFALVLMTRYIDLSIGSALAVFAVLAAKMMGAQGSWVQWNPWLVSLLVICAGLAYGASQGWLVTAWKFNPFVLSVGLLAAMRGLAFLLEGGRYAEDLPREFLYLGQSRIRGLDIPLSVVIAAVVAGIAYFYLHSTRHGRHTQAIAGSARASFLVGIPVQRRIVLLYAVLGAGVALAALMVASKLNSGPASIGNGFELQVLTAVLLGGVAFEGGRGTVLGVILGAIFINMFNNGLLQWGVDSNTSYFINGLILAAAAGLPALSSRLATRRAARQASKVRA